LGTLSGIFYSNEAGEPSHIHVRSGNFEAKIWLHDLTVAANADYPAHELGDIIRHHQDESRTAPGGMA
jgi:hypothetical protein